MSATEQTLILLKPDALERGVIGEILRRFERAGLRICDMRRVEFSHDLLELHYAALKDKQPRAYDRNARYLAGRQGFAIILEGIQAVAKTRLLVGPTEPASAPPGTIRGDLSSDAIMTADAEDRGLYNLVHAADSRESALREIGLWFGRGRT